MNELQKVEEYIRREKIESANLIVKEYVQSNYARPHYVYVDFYEGNRFIDEILSEEAIDIDKSSVEELAYFAIERIVEGANAASLLGF